jgi:hypothetical protein
MAEFLAAYPADVLVAAVNEAITRVVVSPEDGSVRVLGFDCMPSTRQMVEICERLIEPRRAQLRAIERAENECRAHEQEAAARAAEAEQEAQRAAEKEARRQAYMQGLEERARERFGNDAPLPGDIELVDSIFEIFKPVRRGGSHIWLLDALDRGEPSAAKFCRLMALAERTRRASQQGRIAWNECLAIGKLISRDEVAARAEVEKAEAREARQEYAAQPPESFWSALRRINKACGLDVPPSEDPDAIPTAVENLKHLTGLAAPELAAVREISERQMREKWAAEHPGLAWAAPARELPATEPETEPTKEQE